jgi:hypothetical protein
MLTLDRSTADPDPEQGIQSPTAVEEVDGWSAWGAAADGARTVITPSQVFVLVAVLALGGFLTYVSPERAIRIALDSIAFMYLLTGLHKVRLLMRAEKLSRRRPRSLELPADHELPMYTVMVPLHREGRVIPSLV